MTDIRDRIDAFWPTFLAAHLDRRTRICHLAGNAIFFAVLAWAAGTGRYAWMSICFIGYAPSWIGHFIFEKNSPVTLGSPVISGLCDLKMLGLTFAGKLDAETTRLFGSARPTPGTPPIHGIEDELIFQRRLRMRIREEIPEHPFTTYWPIFVLKHQRPINVFVHVSAMVFLYALIVTTIVTGHWNLLILVPLSQSAGLISHALTERTHIDFGDAIFSLRAFSSLNRMMFLFLSGRWGREVSRVRDELDAWKAEQRN